MKRDQVMKCWANRYTGKEALEMMKNLDDDDKKIGCWRGKYAGNDVVIIDDGSVDISNINLTPEEVEAIVMAYAWRYGTGTIDAKFNRYLDSMEANEVNDG